ncbi:MAG: hybrid sensor histidine kinase/response regulator [Bacteroidetes bacterium]|nr:hybrid sensor histidine kinase/response regulator [Bacteroidota bacterium]
MITEKIKVLYVDDEENNLVAFRANFRKEYDVYTAISAAEALALLETTPIHIIISDQRMPQTTGVEFLEQTVKLYPDSIRLLITGQSDIEVVIEAINRGQVSKFIQKPWDWEKLSIAMDNCATLYRSRIELKLKNIELQKANDELNKFVYSVSHDLRSPLTSILGVINLTKMTPELNVASSYFEMIEGRVLKLDNFIKKIIDYYKNARDEENKDTIDFQALISSVWNTLKNQNQEIEFDLTVNSDSLFIGDLLRLEIIFENLISNAIKYQNPSAKEHYIKIKVDVSKEEAHISVSDNGIGINQAYIDRIFNLFFRTEDSLQTEGTGIGLYIVKEAIEKMAGKITVSSLPMEGTTFNIIIPNNRK